MYQRGRSNGVARFQAAQLAARENAEFVVHEADESVDGSSITLAPRREHASDLVIPHAYSFSVPGPFCLDRTVAESSHARRHATCTS